MSASSAAKCSQRKCSCRSTPSLSTMWKGPLRLVKNRVLRVSSSGLPRELSLAWPGHPHARFHHSPGTLQPCTHHAPPGRPASLACALPAHATPLATPLATPRHARRLSLPGARRYPRAGIVLLHLQGHDLTGFMVRAAGRCVLLGTQAIQLRLRQKVFHGGRLKNLL